LVVLHVFWPIYRLTQFPKSQTFFLLIAAVFNMKISEESLLNEIVSLLMAENNKIPIPREKVKKWMKSDNLEVLGAVFSLLTEKPYYLNIAPPFSIEDYHPFMKHYYKRCFLENPDGEWSSSRYEAGWSFVYWFIGLWDDSEVSRHMIDELKIFLAQLYKNGDDNLRTCIVTATLEHLFERRYISQYFADWKNDPILKIAYSEAMEWSSNQQA